MPLFENEVSSRPENQKTTRHNTNLPQLDDADIRLFARTIHRDLRHTLDPVLDRVRHMGHNLDGLSEIVAPALLLDDVQVDLASGDVVLAREAHREIPLVVAEIEINLAAYKSSAFPSLQYAKPHEFTNPSTGQSTRRARPGP